MVTLSQKELQRVRVIEKAVDGRLSVREAACLLQRSERQVQRLKRRYQPNSVDWVRHGNRGKPRPWALDRNLGQQVLELARGKYAGFNDTHLQQKLVEEEGFTLSRESVRRILRKAKRLSPQKRRPRQYRARRQRRARFGMMLQSDASRHDWLEGRGPRLTLIGFQDDATSRVPAAQFQLEPENAVGYLRCLHALLTTHGIPLSLYRDRHSIFQRNDPHWTVEEELTGQQFPTQVGRALEELGIQQIPANSPQAKGRIERLWRTFQDRLISELRLAQAGTVDQANHVLRVFLSDFNRRFAVPAAESSSDFRPLLRRFDLARCLSFRYQRVVAADHTVTWGGEIFQLPPSPSRQSLAGKVVELSHQLDGSLHFYLGQHLLLSLQRPLQELAEPKPAVLSSALKRKPKPPRVYSLGGRPALAAVT
jgi:transposase